MHRFVAGYAALMICACSKTETAKVDTTTPSAAPAAAPTTSGSMSSDGMVLVRGAITSVTATQVVVKTDSGSVTVNTPQPVQVFARMAGDLSKIGSNTFIGVTTVKQPDGTEQATEIHIFPEELRGLGEGARPMAGTGGATPNKMTNGSASTMTNGSASTMTNGAASPKGKTIVVTFPGGQTDAVVPANTPVTEIKATDKKLAAGDQVVVVATKGADGSLTSQKVLMAK